MTRRNGIGGIAVCGALLLAAACGGGSSSHLNTIVASGSNVQPISVNAGPAGSYTNGAFTSVTVCTPGTSTCQTIGGILVDTGSSGLRLLSSALTVSLTQQKAADGNPVVECLPFVSGYTWGPVQIADIQISGEKASSLPVQVISASDFPVPSGCSSHGQSQDNSLGANGLLGVGNFAQDCGGACVSTGPANPDLYYECPASGCVVTGEALAQQVQNPVTLFATDNNGVILELPAVTSPQASISGSLVFGIGTQSNNGLNGATIYAVDPGTGNFTTSYNNQSYPESFLDSGSNGYFFLNSSLTGIPTCQSFYCPSSTQNLSAMNDGANGSGSGTVQFSVANADALPNVPVLGDLAGPNSLLGFDWGLPFFYGRNVFTAIEGQNTPGGAGPYWAY
ncbi:MAG: DUF3443 domain-containing protein [Candidatus Sulfotelmatobacter sp.]